jgi:2-oxoglutarate dehydrogenase E1 component
LLRHRLAVSTIQDLTSGGFQELIPEIDNLNSKEVTRVVLCSGKVYYDVLQQRRDKQLNHVAIVRIEQLYPFPETALRNLLAQYTAAKEVVWCQEEPKNQGAWYCSSHHMQAALAPHQTLSYAGRDSSASPAVGYHSLHVEQQNKLVADALGLSASAK